MSMAERISEPPAPVPTPCIGVCELDEASGLCLGCARTGEEVAAWQDAAPGYKLGIWDELPPRRAEMALTAYRLPWSPDDIAAMIERTLRRRWGRWVLGVEGASASFEIGPGEDADIVSRADAITAITARGALRLAKHRKTIAVAFGNAAEANGPEAIGLILPRGRVELREGNAFAKAGPDVEAICGTCRDAQLYDLGAQRHTPARFCLRTDNPGLIDVLDRSADAPGHAAIADADAIIDAAHPHCVVETGLGRVEIFTPPASGAVCSTRAELRSGALEDARDLPGGWTLPPVFAPCALFYPRSRKSADALLDGHF
jgi:predicted Fe-S protein YdhL (DUF1289 family)